MPIAAHLPEIAPGLPLAWLATYLVHSTLLLGAAWGASRLLRGRALGLEETLWKVALVGGLLTATLQTGIAGLGAGSEAARERALISDAAERALVSTSTAVADAPGTLFAGAAARPAPDPRLSSLAAVLPGWQRLLLAGWLVGAAVLGSGLAFSWLRLRARLRGRHELAGGPVRRLLDRLLAEAEARAASGAPAPPAAGGVPRRVRLTGSPALPVPVALGVGEREICLPRRALTELGERRQRGLLAHELAHLERRDPAWLLASRAIESLLFLQPLNRLARARLQEISELRCDAWAVAATGDRIGLARCLTEVAGWLARDRAALPVPGMARSRRRLGVRVKRILEGTAEEPPARRRWLPAAAGALLLAGAALVPGLPPSSFAAPQAEAPAAAGPAGAVAGGGPARPPESEGSAASAPPSGPEAAAPAESGPADDEDFENGLGFDHGFDFDFDDFDFDDFDFDFDFDYDFDHDFDLGHDFEPDLAASFDSEEISRLVAEAVAAAQAARVDPAELTAIIQETREAMGEEEWARLQAELARAHAELERANGHLGEELEAELRRADEELERAGEEIQRANRELEEHRRALEWERERREEAPPPRSPRR